MPRQPFRRAEGGQGGFVEAAQDELALAGVGDGVAHGVDAGHVGGEGGGVHHELFALQCQAPFGDRAQAGYQAQAHEQQVQRQAQRRALGGGQLQCGEVPGFFHDAAGHADGDLNAARCAQGLQLLQQGGWGVKNVAAVL